MITKKKHFDKIMGEMCRVVGAVYKLKYLSWYKRLYYKIIGWKDVNPKESGWFQKHNWSEAEQESFREWMVNYLYNSSEAREEILTFNVKNKALIGKAVSKFLFCYGWSVK